jgi:hypothetical protein
MHLTHLILIFDFDAVVCFPSGRYKDISQCHSDHMQVAPEPAGSAPRQPTTDQI